MGLIPRRHRSLIYKLLVLIPVVWITVALVIYTENNRGGDSGGGGGEELLHRKAGGREHLAVKGDAPSGNANANAVVVEPDVVVNQVEDEAVNLKKRPLMPPPQTPKEDKRYVQR